MGKTDFQAIRTTKRLEFRYKNEFYAIEIRSDLKLEYTYIWKLQEKIWGPMMGDQTEEGERLFKMITKKLEKGKLKF